MDPLSDITPLFVPIPKPPREATFWHTTYSPFDPSIDLPMEAWQPTEVASAPDLPVSQDVIQEFDLDGMPNRDPQSSNISKPLSFDEYPIADLEAKLRKLQLPRTTKVPTLNDHLALSAMDSFVATLDPRVQAKLDQPFGKATLDRCFRTEPRLRHVLIQLWKSGFLSHSDPGWTILRNVYSPADVLLQLLEKYGDTDFTQLQGYTQHWNDIQELDQNRIAMATAALLHFNCSAADLVRWMGGPHVGQHRDHPSILKRLQAAGVPRDLYETMHRIFYSGIPNYCNADSTEDNFQAFYTYGNHATAQEDPLKTLNAVVKDNKKGYTILFDPDLIPFLLNCHVTPQGVVDLDTINKNPRPIFDSSFRPYPWSFAINDWTDKSNEPRLTFANAELNLMIWVYNLRISYPTEEIYLADDDVSGAFRHTKYGPELVAMHTSVQCGIGVLNTGATFGDCTSPSNFDPIARARRFLAQYLWLCDHGVVDRASRALPIVQLNAAPTMAESSAFTQADADDLHTGVFYSTGDRRPPPYPMHVDDNLYADIGPFLERTVSASAAALFDLLGWPNEMFVPTPLSMDKLESFYNHERRMVGRHFDSRRLTVGMLPYKRTSLLELLQLWVTKPDFTLTEIAQLLGTLDNHTRYARWARCWYFTLQNLVRLAMNKRYHALSRIANRFHQGNERYQFHLPTDIASRLHSLISKDKAAFLWNNRCTFPFSDNARQCTVNLLDYVHNSSNPWETPIGQIIPRQPHFVSTGDASFVGCGGSCPLLSFWFDLPWTQRTKDAVKKKPKDAGFVHINDLEFITLIIMLAAVKERLLALPLHVQQTCFPKRIPTIPVWLGYTDNTVSKSWEAKATAKSKRGQSLIGIYSSLLRDTNIHTVSKHIKGVDNIVADDISRNDFSLSLPSRFAQLFAKHPSLVSFDYFLPSPSFLQLLTSRLYCEPNPTPCDLPAPLGRFVPAGSTTFTSPSL